MSHSPSHLELCCISLSCTSAVDTTCSQTGTTPVFPWPTQTLHSLQTGFTGTCIKNRADLPDDIRGQLRLQHGQVAAYRADHLLTLAWLAEKKKKPVIMDSTRTSAALTTVSSRSTPTVKLVVVDSYNHQMNGVDCNRRIKV